MYKTIEVDSEKLVPNPASRMVLASPHGAGTRMSITVWTYFKGGEPRNFMDRAVVAEALNRLRSQGKRIIRRTIGKTRRCV